MSSPFKDRMGNQLGWETAVDKIFNRFWNYWLEFETGVLWYIVGAVPLHTVRLLCYQLAGVKIGNGSRIHMFARFYNPAGVSIGEDSLIGDQVVLDGRAPLKIGSHVDIASGVKIYNGEHDVTSADFGPHEEKVEIGDYVFIGPNAIILPGVTIGKGAVVGAGAVVTKDVAEFTIVGGVPAKEIGQRPLKNPQYRLGRARLFQ
ncbi:MAG TPA: acyltransferase [Candidatus Saccharimonadia bacterium]|nr:acyltransferase [Candidatus Saccharimonadia bacterium]